MVSTDTHADVAQPAEVLLMVPDDDIPPETIRMAADSLASHGVKLPLPTPSHANLDIPPHACGFLKCAMFPCAPCAACPVICCCCVRSPRHELWGKTFEAALAMLRAGTATMARSLRFQRLLTDPPLAVMPLWLPTMPAGIGCAKNVTAPHGMNRCSGPPWPLTSAMVAAWLLLRLLRFDRQFAAAAICRVSCRADGGRWFLGHRTALVSIVLLAAYYYRRPVPYAASGACQAASGTSARRARAAAAVRAGESTQVRPGRPSFLPPPPLGARPI